MPLSAGHYNRSIKKTARPRIEQLEAKAAELERLDFYHKLAKNWRKQLGSLGSGNHFIEIVLDEEGYVWAFLHSGSRGIGNRIARPSYRHRQKADDQVVHHPARPRPRLPGGGRPGV